MFGSAASAAVSAASGSADRVRDRHLRPRGRGWLTRAHPRRSPARGRRLVALPADRGPRDRGTSQRRPRIHPHRRPRARPTSKTFTRPETGRRSRSSRAGSPPSRRTRQPSTSLRASAHGSSHNPSTRCCAESCSPERSRCISSTISPGGTGEGSAAPTTCGGRRTRSAAATSLLAGRDDFSCRARAPAPPDRGRGRATERVASGADGARSLRPARTRLRIRG